MNAGFLESPIETDPRFVGLCSRLQTLKFVGFEETLILGCIRGTGGGGWGFWWPFLIEFGEARGPQRH